MSSGLVRSLRPLRAVVVLAVALLAGCAGGAPRTALIRLESPPPAPTPPIEVQAGDFRAAPSAERKSFNVSLGRVEFLPPPVTLVKAVVEQRAAAVAARRAVAPGSLVEARLTTWDLATPNTALYWDVQVKIEATLRLRGPDVDRVVTAVATERTWVYPSDAIITRVAQAALARFGDEAEAALAALLVR
jgi:hypothetical protein